MTAPDFPVPLILIDVQVGFTDPVWGTRNNPGFEANVARLLADWRSAERPVFHVRHRSTHPDSPLHPARPGVRFMDFAEPRGAERVITKNVNSAFIGTGLEVELRALGARSVVLAGLTTDHCVSTTARMAANLGFHVVVAPDATATFERRLPDGGRFDAELVHRVSLASLSGEFADLRGVAELGAAEH